MPLQASQDLDARFSVFLNPIKDLTKNWEVDIAKYLEDYLVELSEIQITFDGGVTVMNFAEAAMLIQGSATVYSKKVEFLWQMVLQMLDLLSSKKSLEVRTEETQKDGGKTLKQSSVQDFVSLDSFTFGKNISRKEEEEEEEVLNEFKFLPAMPLHLVEKEAEKSQAKVILYLKNYETFGNKEDFRINRSYLTPSGLLSLDVPPEILRRNACKGIALNEDANKSIAGFLLEKSMQQLFEAAEENAPDLLLEDEIDMDGGFEEPEPILQSPVLKTVNVETAKNLVEEEQLNVGKSNLRRQAKKEVVEELKLTEPLKPLDPHVETPAKRPIRAGRIRKPIPCNCHKEVFKKNSRSRSKLTKDKETSSSPEKPPALPLVEAFITKELAQVSISHNNNNSHGGSQEKIDSRLIENLAKEESRKQEFLKKSRDKQAFEDKERQLLGVEEKDMFEENERLQNVFDDSIPDLDFDHVLNEPELELPDPHQEIVTPFGLVGSCNTRQVGNKLCNDTLLYEPASDYEALVQKWVADYITNAQEHITSSDLTRRVNRWKKNIAPKLLEEEERKAFDIHDYGSHVLSYFSSEESTEPVLFSTIVKEVEPREVSRIFLSCLMLANTYNVGLSQVEEGDLEMDCLQLKLLSKVRHHKEIEGYSAPSQTTKVPRREKNKRKKVEGSSDEENSRSDLIDNDVIATEELVFVEKEAKNRKKVKEND